MKGIVVLLFALVSVGSVLGQAERKHIRQGNKEFKSEKFENSEVAYRKAAEESIESFDAAFNIGDALYKQEKYEDAIKQFGSLTNRELSKEQFHQVYHNLGNSLLSTQKFEESIEAYKQALRNNPKDYETKYNLAFAQEKLKQQQQQQQQQQNQDQNKDDKDQDKDQENQDQQNKDQENQDQQDKQQQQQQNQDKKEQGDQKQQPQPQKISKEDAERLLQALQRDEKKTQDKLQKQKAKAVPVKTNKEW